MAMTLAAPASMLFPQSLEEALRIARGRKERKALRRESFLGAEYMLCIQKIPCSFPNSIFRQG